MTTEFLSWLQTLPAEGETALFVRQSPLTPLQYFPDGAIKATWPAFRPSARLRMREGEAWYGNTASFIEERIVERVSAAAANCEHVLVMVLDDIGTKSKTPPLAPTWRMETSPGNEQWGYAFAFDDQPTKADFAAAIRAIADAGFTDPGACNPVRNFRLPGSANLKQGREGFASRLVEFDPSREYTLAGICAALGVTPGDAAAYASGPRAVRVTDDGGDDVAAWLSAQGMVYSRPNGEGWMGVLCPNAAEHTDGSPEGRYMPANRAFCCLHGHCTHIDSEQFLRWVAAQGGPSHATGLRDELIQNRLAGALPTPATPAAQAAAAQAQSVLDEVDRKEAGRVEQSKWFARFAYLHADDGYFDLEARKEFSRANFNAIFRHINCLSVHSSNGARPRRVEASISFDEHRQAMGARVLQGVTYAAGEGVMVARSGDVYANLWRDARPAGAGAGGGGGDVSLWLAHVERMVPDAMEREHLLNWMAHKVQFPQIKINHGVLHAGHPGSGKDTLWEPFLYAIGGVSRANVALVRNEELGSQWGYPLMSEVLVINELRQTDVADRRALENRLKPLLAAPPELIPVNRKGLHPFEALNRLAVVAFSNERLAITLPSDDRRWFVMWSEAARMAPDAAQALWRWYDAGGRGAVAGWLAARDVSAWNPAATPPVTDAKLAMMAATLSSAESAIVEMMRERRGEFSQGAVMAPWASLCDRLAGLMPPGTRVGPHTLLHAAREAGWMDLGMVKSLEHATKRHILCAPDVLEAAGNSRAEIRRRCEAARAGAGGTVVAIRAA
jgi:hypothetical protein